MVEFRLTIFAVCFFSLILSFALGYIYNIYTLPSFNTYISRESNSETEEGLEIVPRRKENASSTIRQTR